ncbi:hypothetical protein SAMN06297144_2984 [Sphingomonas guangdongensis]|uniref:Uncharacterized protein n=1 Tax=Sphingomonas guangdongensis TaxID=1141890 RepID=A0A285R677_9SPHN|nr:hypothetical protein [Sphingomonas guangdongensis]SOB87847.1 hypothetical protein SAMN06297144_2984 [Sphingomonas guangdongensis]
MLAWFSGGAVLMALAVPGGGRPALPLQARQPLVLPANFTLNPVRSRLAVMPPLVARYSPRLEGASRSARDPAQFAALRAMPVDRGGFRGSPINAKLEWKLSGDLGGIDSQLGVSGVPRLISRALLR